MTTPEVETPALPTTDGLDERAFGARVGHMVRVAMAGREVSSTELAGEVLHVSQGALAQRLSGRTSFRAYELALIAERLEVHPGFFFQSPEQVLDRLRNRAAPR